MDVFLEHRFCLIVQLKANLLDAEDFTFWFMPDFSMHHATDGTESACVGGCAVTADPSQPVSTIHHVLEVLTLARLRS